MMPGTGEELFTDREETWIRGPALLPSPSPVALSPLLLGGTELLCTRGQTVFPGLLDIQCVPWATGYPMGK